MQISFHKWAVLLVFHALFTDATSLSGVNGCHLKKKCIFMNTRFHMYRMNVRTLCGLLALFFSALQTCSMADVHLCIRSALNVSTRKLLVKPCNQLNGPILRWTQTPEAEYSHNHFSIHFSIIGDGTSTIATSTNQQRKSTRQ